MTRETRYVEGVPRDDDFYLKLGRRIAALRRAKGLTQERLAEATELGPSHIARVEAGQRRLALGPLRAVAVALDVPVSQLFDEDSAKIDDDWQDAIAGLVVVSRGLAVADVEALAGIARRMPHESPAAARQPPPSYGRKPPKTPRKASKK